MMVDPLNKARAKLDFDKAQSKAFFSDIFSRLFHKDNALLQFDEVRHMLSPHGMVYRGLRTVSLDRIIGSEGRYQDFDRNFMPRHAHNRSRWENVDILQMENIELPPVELYQLGEHYFVKDGNHRVSVARERGQEFIDAQVIELLTRVDIEEGAPAEKGLLLAHSKKYFLDQTSIDKLVPESSIQLTTPWGYYRLLEHINNYKYLVSEKEQHEHTWPEAVTSWYYNMYSQVVFSIHFYNVLQYFQGRTEGDLYIWVMDHWHFLKEKYSQVGLEDAVRDYSSRFGIRGLARFWDRIKKAFSIKRKRKDR